MTACSATTRGDRGAGAEVGAGRQARARRRCRRRRKARRAVRRSRRRWRGQQAWRLRWRSGARKSNPECRRRRRTRAPVAASRRRQRCPQRNPRAGLAAPAPRRWQRGPRRRRDARPAAAAPRCVPSHRRPRPAQPHWRRSRRPIVGPTPPYRRHGRHPRQTTACPPRWQRWIVVAALLRQRSGQGWRSSMAVRGRSQAQPARPDVVRSRPTGRVDRGTFRHR